VFHRFLFVAAVMIALAAPSSAQPKPPARIIVPRFPWVASLDAAKTTAKAADVPVLVYLYFPNHAACQNFEESVFTDEKFQELSALFVMVRVDAGLHKDVAQAFGVQRCPSLVFLDSGGVKLYLLDSKMDAKRVLSYMGRSILVSMYNAGKRARGAGDLRTATLDYLMLLAVGEGTPPAAWARRDLRQISADGTKKLSQARIALDAMDYMKTMALLEDLAYGYQFLNPGKEAKTLMDSLASDPQAAAALKEVTRRQDADRLLRRAVKLEGEKKPVDALILYWDVTRDFPGTPPAADAADAANLLAKDDALALRAAKTRMERDAAQWTDIARSFELNGKHDKAVEFYQRIINTYPDTPYAQKARDAIAALLKPAPAK